jgi:hypothetical protein
MKPVLWFRIASILLLIFAAGHTIGFLTFKAATPDGQAVWSSMNSVRLPMGKSSFTYGNFYIGFGLFVSALFILEAFLAWYCGRLVSQYSAGAIVLGWCLLILQLVCLVLSWRYFGGIQVIMSFLTVVTVSVALWLTYRFAQ